MFDSLGNNRIESFSKCLIVGEIPSLAFLWFSEPRSWNTALESDVSDTSEQAAEKWHQHFMDVSAFVKAFTSKDEVKNVKDNLAEFRAWCAEYKKGCNKKKRLSVTSANEPEDRPAASQQQLPTWRGLVEHLLDPSCGEYR